MTRPGLSIYSAETTRGWGSRDHRGQLNTGTDLNPVTLAGWSLEFFWSWRCWRPWRCWTW